MATGTGGHDVEPPVPAGAFTGGQAATGRWAARIHWRGAVAGLLAAAVALSVAELVAVATGVQSAPLVAVGEAVIDGAPAPMVEFGITVFGLHDKTALLVGMLVLVAVAAAVIGAVALRRLWVGLVGLAVFAVIGVVAALTRHGAAGTVVLPTMIGAIAGGAVFVALRQLLRPGGPSRPPAVAERLGAGRGLGPAAASGRAATPGATSPSPPAEPAEPARRRFVQAVGLGLVGAAVLGFGSRWAGRRRELARVRADVDLPVPADFAPPVPAGADLRVPDLASYVTGNRVFYRIDTAFVAPVVDPRTWSLRVHGRVRRPYDLTFPELLARPMIERYITLACVSNEVGGDLVGNARWLGVPVAELLAEAEPLPGADQVVSRSVDGWTCGTPTSVLTDGRDALLAVGMNGAPLPGEHGFPARMVVPGLYGYVSACKWITEIELTSFADYDAYWVPRGWAAQAPIKTQSRIDTPRRRATAGPVIVAGVAWAQHRGIAQVEVRVDGGEWHVAELAGTVSADTWRQWSWRWEATAGEHSLTVRATDATGETQPAQPSQPKPDGATGWHTIQVAVS